MQIFGGSTFVCQVRPNGKASKEFPGVEIKPKNSLAVENYQSPEKNH